MFRKLSSSIKYKFLITTIVLFLTFSIITIYQWYSMTSIDAEKSAISYVNEVFKDSNANFEVTLKDINAVVINLSIDPEIINILMKKEYTSPKEQLADTKTIEGILRNLYSYKHYINGIMIGNLNNVSYTGGIGFNYEEMISQTWFKSIMSSDGKNIIIPPHYYSKWISGGNDVDYNDMVISLARPVKQGSTAIGFVIADVKGKLLNSLYNIKLKDNGTVFVVDSASNEFIFKPGTNELPTSFGKSDIKEITDKINSSNGHFYYKTGGRDYLLIYYFSPFTKWITVGMIPREKLLEGFSRTRNTLVYLSVFFCMAAISVTYLISSLITKNLLKLDRAMKKIDRDNLDISVVIKSNDEVGGLYRQFNLMVERIKGLIEDIKEKEKEKRKSEMRALQAQINPHFLYNTLNTIKFLASLQGADNIVKVSESLSTMMHINMEDRMFIHVEEEIMYIKSYLNIQLFKYSNKFTMNIVVEEEVKKYMVLKMLLQPIVENALRHGIGPLPAQGNILIKVYAEENTLKMRVQDNGPGISEERIGQLLNTRAETHGIGLSNVLSRIKLNFGDNYGISVLSEPYFYTTVEISVPLITEEEVENYV